MQLGILEKNMPLFLAPLAGYTDKTFRAICRVHGCDMTVTEMVSAKGLFFGSRKTSELLATDETERPVIVQIFGHEPEIMGEMAKKICADMADSLLAIDINMGCPAKKITANGEGSALMRSPILAGKIVSSVRENASVPVTVKMRLGVDAAHINAAEIARIAEENGAAAVTVHGRTADRMYAGTVDYEAISKVKQSLSIPVIANGDVTDVESARKAIQTTGCDGLMIGRGALGNPWVFEEIRAALDGRPWCPPDWEQRMSLAVQQAEQTEKDKGRQGILELRKHLIWYFRGKRGSVMTRTRLQQAETVDEIRTILLDTCGNSFYN